MSSCCTLRLKRRRAFSRDSPSCSRISAKQTHPQTRPEGPNSYYKDFNRPDPHARTAWELAWHLANTNVQFLNSIADLQFATPLRSAPDKPQTVVALVDWYDKNVKRGIKQVQALSAEQLLTPVKFFMFNFPAVFYLGFENNHSIHHRGELATYLRPMGSKVPAIYGGSFDEPLQAAT